MAGLQVSNPRVRLETAKGSIVIELFPEHAPLTVQNFLELVEEKFYDGQIFYRVIPNFLVQTGCPKGDGSGGPGYTIPCECVGQSLTHDEPGIVAMAHSGRDTGGSQFYITVSPQTHLDNEYTIFGKVVEGIDIVSGLIIGDIIIRIERELPVKSEIIAEEKPIIHEEAVIPKNRIEFLPALSISVIVTISLILAFRLLNLDTDPLQYQLELILILFSISLVGILTRSKTKSMGSALVAIFTWTMTLLDSRMPWALGKRVGELGMDFIVEMESLSSGSGLQVSDTDLSMLRFLFSLGTIFDLVFLVILALNFAFFCSVLATGFFHKDGSFAWITIFTKPLALIFVLILIPMPIAYHGVMKAGESSIALGTGAVLLAEQADEVEKSGEANTSKITEMTAVFKEAQEYFDISRKAFNDLQANYLYSTILAFLEDQEIQKDLTLGDFVDIAEPVVNALYFLAAAAPDLYGGVAYLMDGLEDTFEAMGMGNGLGLAAMKSQSLQSAAGMQALDLDPVAFTAGKEYLETALDFFAAASENVSTAFSHVEAIFEKTAYQKLTKNEDEYTADAFKALRLMDDLIPLSIDMSNGTIFFVMTAYSILSAIEKLQQNEFDLAKNQLLLATENHTTTNSVIGNALAILDPDFGDNELTSAFWGGVRALANMTMLSDYFINATSHGTDTLVAVNQTLDILSRIDLNATAGDSQTQQDWQNSGININWAGSNISVSTDQIRAASQLASDMISDDYGNLNESMHDSAQQLLEQIGEDNQTGFWGNVTDFADLISVANYSHQGFYSFAVGFAEYTNATLLFNTTGNWSDYSTWSQGYIDKMTNASTWFDHSSMNASAGETIIASIANIDEATRLTLESSLQTLQTEALICQGLTESTANGTTTAIAILNPMNQALANVETAQGELANTFTASDGAQAFYLTNNRQRKLILDDSGVKTMRTPKKKEQDYSISTVSLFFAAGLLAVVSGSRRRKEL